MPGIVRQSAWRAADLDRPRRGSEGAESSRHRSMLLAAPPPRVDEPCPKREGPSLGRHHVQGPAWDRPARAQGRVQPL